MSDNAVTVYEPPRELSVVEVKAQVAKVQNLMRDLMQEGTHYGESFQGDKKKNLLKPGADKLCFMFRLRPDFTQDIKELPGGHMEVLTRCQIYHIESGNKIAEGVGFASTMESKYRWRNAARKCPACGKETIIKGKEEYGGGWICFAKKGGCGEKYKDNDPAITGQESGKVENTDIADTYNTVLKMSKKRAYVDATITACAASDIFSQDAEDFKESPESLAHAALAGDEAQPKPKAAPPPTKPEAEAPTPERTKVINEIAEIMKSLSTDETPFFTDAEKDMEKAVIKGAVDMKTLKNQRDRLRKELEKREAEYKPIPFDPMPDTAQQPTTPIPAMYSENEDDGFEDDIPEAVPADSDLDIF